MMLGVRIDVARTEVEQVAVLRQLPKPEACPSSRGLDHEDRECVVSISAVLIPRTPPVQRRPARPVGATHAMGQDLPPVQDTLRQ